MMSKLERQKYDATIIAQQALIQRLRIKLCGDKHTYIIMDKHFIYGTGVGGPGTEVEIKETSVCTVCEHQKVEIR